jgi:hypothetical protein
MYRYTTFVKFPLVEGQTIDMKDQPAEFGNPGGSAGAGSGGGSGGRSKLQTRVPLKVLEPPKQYKPISYNGYRFFLPKSFYRRKGKESEFCKDDEGITLLM